MLKEYFAIDIDERGLLRGLPILLTGHAPHPGAIPGFLYRLANGVEWQYEKACFEGIARALGVCYATLPLDEPDVLNDASRSLLRTTILPALKALLLAPEHLPDEAALKKLTSLERLFRVFERC